ncbi:MAG: isochorismatase family protein [Actinomycetota bacterium]|nr:isochorismatase family protein [Actinomycetota bacterium]
MREEEKNKKLNTGSHLIKREDSVLVVVDIQEKLTPYIKNNSKVIENVVKMIKFAQIIGLPIVLTEQKNLGNTVKEIKKELSGITPITKIEFSACKCSEFVKKIDELSRKNIILTGIETHICIAQTALELLPHFNVHVVGDATSSRSIEDMDIALNRLERSGAIINSTEMLMYELMERAGTEEFKKVLKIVKGK